MTAETRPDPSALPSPPPDLDCLLTTERLSPPQRRFLAHFTQTPLSRRFYLSGGAALAAGWLAHRPSDDLDFFGPDPIPLKKLIRFMEALPGLDALQWLLPRDRTTFVITWEDGSQVKVEYRQFPFAPLAPRHVVGPLYLDSLPDLVANKLFALVERRYELDRVDLYLALRFIGAVTVSTAVRSAEAKFDLGGTLTEFVPRRLTSELPAAAPPSLLVPVDIDQMARFFERLLSPPPVR